MIDLVTQKTPLGAPDGAEAPAEPPRLTLPADEAAWVREAYAGAGAILEYGSGGSTVLAAGMPGKTVFSVESDRRWAARMEAWFEAHPPAARVIVHHADVGPTRKWGMPTSQEHWRTFHRYPLAVWDLPDFVHPDVVLIDGRFRAACLLAVLYRASRPVTVLFDDYGNRRGYHRVESFVKPMEVRGRMARFEIEPEPFPAARMTEVFDIFTRPL